jgi:superfamily I DNA and/or RNA helicase
MEYLPPFIVPGANKLSSAEIEDYMIQSFVSQADVICTTLVGSAHSYLKNIIFDTVFIDETSQALEPATWIPILKSKSVVLAGDPFQLPPTVKSDKAMQLGLAKTLLDRAFELKDNVFLINFLSILELTACVSNRLC